MTGSLSAVTAVDEWFARLRADTDRRRLAIAVGVVVGLALAWCHWIGLMAAGAMVGLPCQSTKRAVLAAMGFGLLVLAVTVAMAPKISPTAFLGMTRIAAVTIVVTLVVPMWGSLLRAVV